jgi:hypothetical protein
VPPFGEEITFTPIPPHLMQTLLIEDQVSQVGRGGKAVATVGSRDEDFDVTDCATKPQCCWSNV